MNHSEDKQQKLQSKENYNVKYYMWNLTFGNNISMLTRVISKTMAQICIKISEKASERKSKW